MMDRDMVVEEVEFDGCPGWKNPSECPHEGVYDPDSPACKECVEDALEAMCEYVCGEIRNE